jgi:hypothetical protein
MWPSRRGSVGLLWSAAALAAAVAATAQTTTGAVEGRVVGPDGGVLPGVTVTATGALPASRVAETDGFGIYHLSLLPPGSYEVRAELQGYAPQKSNAIVSVVATTHVDFHLSPSLAEEVTVRAEAPQIDLKSVEVSDTVDGKAFERLPLSRAAVARLQLGGAARARGEPRQQQQQP